MYIHFFNSNFGFFWSHRVKQLKIENFQRSGLKTGLKKNFFLITGNDPLYRSRNKDVATLNSIVATRKIVVAAKSGHIFVAWYYSATKLWPHFQKTRFLMILKIFQDFLGNFLGFSRIFQDFLGFSRIFQIFLGFFKIFKDFLRFSRIFCKNPRKFQIILKNSRKFQEILGNSRKSQKILENTRKYQKIVENI